MSRTVRIISKTADTEQVGTLISAGPRTCRLRITRPNQAKGDIVEIPFSDIQSIREVQAGEPAEHARVR